MTMPASGYSDFIVFADESGDHGLDGIDPEFPVFALAFCLMKKTDHAASVVPAFQQLKFAVLRHDCIVFHEHEIRKSKGAFGKLRTDPALRNRFFDSLNSLMEAAPVQIFASVIDKKRLKDRYTSPWNPYEIALLFCMERLLDTLLKEGQEGKLIHVVFESRGKKEDGELELEFRRICANKSNSGYKTPDFTGVTFEPVFVPKAANSTGLQLADLVARPIALNALRPHQANRVFEIVAPKLRGRKCFP